MKREHRPACAKDAGYSVIEMLVVIAIIGIISLVSIPQFMAFQRSNQLKSSMRQMTADLRLARQQAIALRTQTRVRFQTGARQYFVERLVTGTTWTDLGRGGTGTGARVLEQSCSLDTPVDLPTVTIASRSYNAVVFLSDGTASLSTASASFAVRTAYSLSRTSYTIQVQTPGFVKAI